VVLGVTVLERAHEAELIGLNISSSITSPDNSDFRNSSCKAHHFVSAYQAIAYKATLIVV
jgi:hypothetical protein